MRFINILVGIILPAAALTGWLWYGYQKTNQANRESGIEQVTFDQYVLAEVRDFVATDTSHLPGGGVTDLDEMLPAAPQGWTARKVSKSDGEALWVADLDEHRQSLLQDAALEDYSDGILQARTAWEGPEGVLIAELVRYPDSLFTTREGEAVLAANRAPFGKVGHAPLLNIGGLEIHEAKLLPKMPARVLRADLDGQIVLRVSAPRGMSDDALRAFFTTLNVVAMNAQLAAPITGMGEVALDGQPPLAVLVDQMTDAEHAKLAQAGEIFAAERARIGADREATLAALSEEELAASVIEGSAAVSESVTVRRGVNQSDPGRSSIKTGGGQTGGFRDACKEVGGRKVCGVAAPRTE